MIVKDLMEDTQLNFNQPLLSVRRGPLAATLPAYDKKITNSNANLPYYKSDLKSGPLRNPGSVPFLWEQMPGRPKDETTPQPKTVEKPPLAPKLPPGRIINHIPKHSHKSSTDSALPVSQVEHTLPAADNSSAAKSAVEVEVSTEEMDVENMSTAEDDDSNYVDALDTLSRTESVFLNSSVSGTSGVDALYMKSSGSFTDPHARDFMMGRFLPAAQAVASEMPQFGSRKPQVVKEEVKLPKKAIKWDLQSTVYINSPYVGQEEEDVSDNSEDDEAKGTKSWSRKGCGLFPRLCLLNPIPGMRDVAPVSNSSMHRAYKNPPSTSASSDTRHDISLKSTYRVSKVKKTVICARNPSAPVCSSEMGIIAENRKVKLDKTSYLNDFRKSDESSKDQRFSPKATAPYRNAVSDSFSHEGKSFLGLPVDTEVSNAYKHQGHGQEHKNSRHLLAGQSDPDKSDNAPLAIENTLYIDSREMIDSRSSNLSSSESRWTTDSRRQRPSFYAGQDDKYVRSADGKKAPGFKNLNVNFVVQSSMRKTSHEVQDETEELRWGQDLEVEPRVMARLTLDEGHKPGMSFRQHRKDGRTTNGSNQRTLLAPPLPKSPSESWLSRTLPSMHAQTSRLHPGFQLQQGRQATSPSPIDSKWETMVKGSDSNHMNTYLTEELEPISEN